MHYAHLRHYSAIQVCTLKDAKPAKCVLKSLVQVTVVTECCGATASPFIPSSLEFRDGFVNMIMYFLPPSTPMILKNSNPLHSQETVGPHIYYINSSLAIICLVGMASINFLYNQHRWSIASQKSGDMIRRAQCLTARCY